MIGLAVVAAAAGLLREGEWARAEGFGVDTTADTMDALPGDWFCDDGGRNCSLRAAVEEANALVGMDFVDVPALGVTNFPLIDVDVLWIVSDTAQDLSPSG